MSTPGTQGGTGTRRGLGALGSVGSLTDLQTFGLVMAAGAAAFPLLPHLGVLCPLRRVTGIPCPLCGSTTAVLALSHGRAWDAVVANPGAVLLVICCIGAFLPRRVRLPVASWASSWRERLGGRGRTVVSVVVLLALWAYQLHRFGRW